MGWYRQTKKDFAALPDDAALTDDAAAANRT
jgi:hypothetical protein